MAATDYLSGLGGAKVAYRPIYANRFAPLARTLRLINIDLTGAALQAQVRASPDAGGSPLATLTVGVGAVTSTTWAALVTAGTIGAVPAGYAGGDAVSVADVTVEAPRATVQALPGAPEIGSNMQFYWDLKRTVTDERVLVAGEFVVVGGVSQ